MQFSYDKVPQNVQDDNKEISLIMENQNIRIHLKAYDNKKLYISTEEINTAKRTGAQVKGPIPHKNRKVYSFKISSYRKNREQFESRTHKRLIDIIEPTPQTVEALIN